MITRCILLALLAAALAAALATPAQAQYFGRNKIQYEDFDWYLLETERFDIHGYEAANDSLIVDAGRMAERWYSRLGGIFDHQFDERVGLPLLDITAG